MQVSRSQALAFLDKVIGTELCTGAGEDEAACYRISPVPHAFLEGALGNEQMPGSVHYVNTRDPEKLRPLAEFLIACGTSLLPPEKGGA